MFLKTLKISTPTETIREMKFYTGMNLIIDNTPTDNKKLTGNNVGKTTVLKLIYFCLGGEGNEIFTGEENKKEIYEIVKNYLIDNQVLITLVLADNLEDSNARHIVIERNFLTGKNTIRKINGRQILKKDFEHALTAIIFPRHDSNIKNLETELKTIDSVLYSENFEERLKKQITKFNKYFSEISNELYGEKYALTFDKEYNKKTNRPVYKFSAFNLNMSSGKKQGEILCFDLAYIKFADDEHIACLHFLLNDKKELMHDNQLSKVADFVGKNNIQLVISILKDKLPDGLLGKSNVVVELSQEDKLFRIE